MKKISVVIPAYNEEESLPILYDRMKKLMDNMENYEFEILYLLAKNPGRIFSKEQIYTQVWKEPYYGAEDNVMGIIRRIRKKIEPDSAKPRYILNVWGMGYKFEVN